MKKNLTSLVCKTFYYKSGMAMVIVISFVVVAVIVSGIFYIYTQNQKTSFNTLVNETKALLAAKSLLQMIIYKYRVLPTEFYIVASATRNLNATDSLRFLSSWIDEFRGEISGDKAVIISEYLKKFDGKSYNVGVSSFTLLTREDFGYKRDYIYVEVWGECDGVKKVITELLEVELTKNLGNFSHH